MSRYVIWNKEDMVYTPSGAQFTPEMWLTKHSWGAIPGVKMVIGGGVINGTVAYEFTSMIEQYQRQGCAIDPDVMTDDEILEAIELFEDRVIEYEPTVEERTAAALEFQNMLALAALEEQVEGGAAV